LFQVKYDLLIVQIPDIMTLKKIISGHKFYHRNSRHVRAYVSPRLGYMPWPGCTVVVRKTAVSLQYLKNCSLFLICNCKTYWYSFTTTNRISSLMKLVLLA